jgi:pimeloyl-ACP methyl ester carboxylesterase
MAEKMIQAAGVELCTEPDPMFPLRHGVALAREIPGARLLRLREAGHGVSRPDWETIARAILDHTAAA